jgi:hypothetical protein
MELTGNAYGMTAGHIAAAENVICRRFCTTVCGVKDDESHRQIANSTSDADLPNLEP